MRHINWPSTIKTCVQTAFNFAGVVKMTNPNCGCIYITIMVLFTGTEYFGWEEKPHIHVRYFSINRIVFTLRFP